MMMNSYLPNEGARAARRRLLATTVLVVLVYLIDVVSGGVVRGTLRSAGAFVSGVGSGAVHAIVNTGFFSTRSSLQEQVRVLSEEVTRLQEQNANFSVLKTQNEQLGELTQLAKTDAGITAPIISSVLSSPYGTFMVGAGTEDGVSEGDLVLSAGGFVIGKIMESRVRQSTAIQTFSPEFSFDALILDSAVAVHGRGGGNAYARMPHGIDVNRGDVVIAPQFGGRAVGIVANVASSSASAYSDVFIGLPISLETLQYVYVTSQ